MPLNIAMDGPVGAGKSSVADAAAKRLHMLHLDTGAMYRAVALACLQQDIATQDEAAVVACAETAQVDVTHEADGQHTWLNGTDVTALIRTEAVSMGASTVALYPGVRRRMVAMQRALAAKQDMLVDGRDICTRVLPDATVRIYLTASAESRAKRRFDQLIAKGIPAEYDTVLEDLRKRDEQDMNRATDPLRPAEGAVIVDSTDLTFDETVDAIVRLAEEKRHG